MRFRTDIEGLRAIAVLPVVLFHAGIAGFSGGYVGVDVFFVISGFLITSTIIRDVEKTGFSVARFYEHRIRRLFPAYLLVMIATALLGALIMLPADLASLGQTLLGSALFVSNIVVWQQSGDYFGVANELQPLLHTWSLSVEEQFYVGFPLLIVVWRRFLAGVSLLVPIAGILLVSFALSVYAADHAPVANFFLLPTRAWELALGALIAIRPPQLTRSLQAGAVCGWTGIVMVLAPVFLFDAATPVPSWPGLIPTCGAALIIIAGLHHQTNSHVAFLSNPIFRFFGKISYSLYLWHWPAIVFARYYYIELDQQLQAATILVSIALGFLTYKFVETPFRKPRMGASRPRLFATTLALTTSVAGAGFVLSLAGLPGRVPQQVQQMALKTTYQGPRRDCGGAFSGHKSADELCVLGDNDAEPSVLVVGDSHAEAIAGAVFIAASQVSLSGTQLTDTGYRPFLGYEKVGEAEKYRVLNDQLTSILDSRPEFTHIVLPFYWQQAVNTDQYLEQVSQQKVSGLQGTAEGLRNLIDRYPNRDFLLFTSSAHSLAFGASAAARAAWYGHDDFTPTVSRQSFDKEQSAYQSLLDELSRRQNVTILRASEKLCDRELCYGSMDGSLLYTDDNHLSFFAAQLFTSEFRQWLSSTTTPTISDHGEPMP